MRGFLDQFYGASLYVFNEDRLESQNERAIILFRKSDFTAYLSRITIQENLNLKLEYEQALASLLNPVPSPQDFKNAYEKDVAPKEAEAPKEANLGWREAIKAAANKFADGAAKTIVELKNRIIEEPIRIPNGANWGETEFEKVFLKFVEVIAKELKLFRGIWDPDVRIIRHKWMALLRALLTYHALQILKDEPDICREFTTLIEKHFPKSGLDTQKSVVFWNQRILIAPEVSLDENDDKTWNTKEFISKNDEEGEGYAKIIEASIARKAKEQERQRQIASALVQVRHKHSEHLILMLQHSRSYSESISSIKRDFLQTEFDVETFREKFSALDTETQTKILHHLIYVKELLPLDEILGGLQITEELAKLIKEVEVLLLEVATLPGLKLDESIQSFEEFYSQRGGIPENPSECSEYFLKSLGWDLDLQRAFLDDIRSGQQDSFPNFTKEFDRIIELAVKTIATLKHAYEGKPVPLLLSRAEWMEIFSAFIGIYATNLKVHPKIRDLFLDKMKDFIPKPGQDSKETIKIWTIISPESAKEGKVPSLNDFYSGEVQEALTDCNGYLELLAKNSAWNDKLYSSALVFKEEHKAEAFETEFKETLKSAAEKFKKFKLEFEAQAGIKSPEREECMTAFRFYLKSYENCLDNALVREAFAEMLSKHIPASGAVTELSDYISQIILMKSRKKKKKAVKIEESSGNNHQDKNQDQGGSGGNSRSPTPTNLNVTSIQGGSESSQSSIEGASNPTSSGAQSELASATLSASATELESLQQDHESIFPMHFVDHVIGLINQKPFPSEEPLAKGEKRFLDCKLPDDIEELKNNADTKASCDFYRSACDKIKNYFNDILYGASENSFAEGINTLLNLKMKQFIVFWIDYTQNWENLNSKKAPILPASVMREIFLAFVFTIWPSDQSPHVKNEVDRLGLIYNALVEKLKSLPFPSSDELRKWKQDFQCEFSEKFELEKVSLKPITLQSSPIQHETASAVSAPEESVASPFRPLSPVSPAVEEKPSSHFDEFAIDAIIKKNLQFPAYPSAKEDEKAFEKDLEAYNEALRGFFDIQKILESEVPGEDGKRTLSQEKLRVQQVKFVSVFKPLKDSENDLEEKLSQLLNQNWKFFLEFLVKYRAEGGAFLYTAENLARLFEAYLLPLTWYPTGFSGEDSKSLRRLIFRKDFARALTVSLGDFSSVKELCGKELEFHVYLSGFWTSIDCEAKDSENFVTYLKPKKIFSEVTEGDFPAPVMLEAVETASPDPVMLEREAVASLQQSVICHTSAVKLAGVGQVNIDAQIGKAEDDKGKEEANVSAKQQTEECNGAESITPVEQLSTPEQRSLELIKFLISEKSGDSRYILSLPGNPIFRVPGNRISIPQEGENEASIETESIAIGSFCLETIKNAYLEDDDSSVRDFLLRRLMAIKMEFTRVSASRSQLLFAIEVNKLIYALEPDEKNIFDISIEASKYLEIKRKSLALLEKGCQTLLAEGPKLKKPVPENLEPAPISESPKSLNADESEAASVPKPASAPDVVAYNKAIDAVLEASSTLIANHYKETKSAQEFNETRKTFAKVVRPKFEDLLKQHPILNEYQSIGDKIWTRVLNVAMIIVLPALIIRALYRRPKGLPTLFQPDSFERVARVLQKNVFSNVEAAEKVQIQVEKIQEKSERIVTGALAKEVGLFARRTANQLTENALAREDALREKLKESEAHTGPRMQPSSD